MDQQSIIPQESWHSLPIVGILRRLGTTLEGLPASSVEAARNRYGANILPPPPTRAVWKVWIDQFRSPLIYILLFAIVISFWLKEWRDGLVILGVVLLNSFIGLRQELQANHAMEALLQLSPQTVHVLRDGTERELPIAELVVGDVVVVETGDRLPADGRWIEALNVRLNEATLTGEAAPVSKVSESLPEPTALQERKNMGWRGTTVVAGRGRLIVTAVGTASRFGSIVAKLQAIEHSTTPFQGKLRGFSQRLAFATLVAGVVVFTLGIFRQLPAQDVFLLTVSMVVSIIPEGLPIVITMAMAWGMWEMAKRKAIVRKLAAVETLGAVTVVATDKTGTLTYGEMMVTKMWVDRATYDFSGQGYAPGGDIFSAGKKVLGRELEGLSFALKLGALNNDGRFTTKEDGTILPIGDPTELSLIVAAQKGGWPKLELDDAHPRLGEFAFDNKKKYMVTWHRSDSKAVLVVTKGAPQEVLNMSGSIWHAGKSVNITDADRRAVHQTYEAWAAKALRGLAIAYTIVPADVSISTPESLHGKLTFMGLFGIEDALRPEASDALKLMQVAGIRTIMVTGDYQKTGAAVGQRLGILPSLDDRYLLDGSMVDKLDDTSLRARLPFVRVATRLTPEHKLRIASLMKQDGEVVAMTGDGINDVPALLRADVGIAVGRQSSDAAKEAADIILVDGNFQSVTAAIAEGRRIYRNIRRSVVCLITSNFAGLTVVLSSLLAGFNLPLLPTQIIWLNAVTEPFMGLALAREPVGPMVMKERPHDPKDPIITRAYWRVILVSTLALAAGTLLVFGWANALDRSERNVYALTVTTLALGQWLLAFNLRSSRRSIFSMLHTNRLMLGAFLWVALMQAAILYIPPLAELFQVGPLSLSDWGMVLLGAMPVVMFEEVRKISVRRQYAAAHGLPTAPRQPAGKMV